MLVFLTSLLFITLAEMGDKTQLLAMALATKYKALHVLIGIFFATILNHAFAVWCGKFLTTIIPLNIISLIAAISFIAFGLWTLKGDKLDEKDKDKKPKYGPIITTAILFFIAEMGDKTQLTTVSLAVKFGDFVPVLTGTTLGMLVADAFGIGVGIVLGKKIPEHIIKWVSAGIFILFGIWGVWNVI